MRSARIIAASASVAALLVPLPTSATTRAVDIPGRYFQPRSIAIYVGDTVRWTNTSRERHTVTSSSSSSESFNSSNSCTGNMIFNDCIRPGESFAHTFDRRGTFTYFCQRHGENTAYPNCGMCGRVIVRLRSTATVGPTTSGSPSPTASPTVSGSPSPDATASQTVSPTSGASSRVAAPAEDDGSQTNVLAIAAVAVVLLGGSGFLVYRSFIRR